MNSNWSHEASGLSRQVSLRGKTDKMETSSVMVTVTICTLTTGKNSQNDIKLAIFVTKLTALFCDALLKMCEET